MTHKRKLVYLIVFSQVGHRHQPKCETCLRTPFDMVDTGTFRLKPCDDCRLAFFCSPGCRAEGLGQHRVKQCSTLEDAGACEILGLEHIKETGEAMIQLPSEIPRHTYKPLHTAQNWKDYFEYISESPFARSITRDFSPANDDKATLQMCRFLKVAVDSSSPVLTILAGLESELSDLVSRTKLTIHVVGADFQDICRARMMEEFYHLLPKLRSLVVGYVGPDVGSILGDTTKLLDFECCSECQRVGRSPRQAFRANARYHDFTKSNLFAKYPPELIVALHSGHAKSEIKRWRPTLQCILNLAVPAVFTTYNQKDALDEERVLNTIGARFSRRPAENPWRGVLPKFDSFMDRYDVYYVNYYWYIIKGRIQE